MRTLHLTPMCTSLVYICVAIHRHTMGRQVSILWVTIQRTLRHPSRLDTPETVDTIHWCSVWGRQLGKGRVSVLRQGMYDQVLLQHMYTNIPAGSSITYVTLEPQLRTAFGTIDQYVHAGIISM